MGHVGHGSKTVTHCYLCYEYTHAVIPHYRMFNVRCTKYYSNYSATFYTGKISVFYLYYTVSKKGDIKLIAVTGKNAAPTRVPHYFS